MPRRRSQQDSWSILSNPDGSILHCCQPSGRRRRRLLRMVPLRLRIRRRNRHDGPSQRLLLNPRSGSQRSPHRLRPLQRRPPARPLHPRKGTRGLQQTPITIIGSPAIGTADDSFIYETPGFKISAKKSFRTYKFPCR